MSLGCQQAAPTVPRTGRWTEHVAPDAGRQHLPSPAPPGGQNTSPRVPTGSVYRPPHRQVTEHVARTNPPAERQHPPSSPPPGGQNTSPGMPAGSTYRPQRPQVDRTRRPGCQQAAPTVPRAGGWTADVVPDAERQHLPSLPPAGGQKTSSRMPEQRRERRGSSSAKLASGLAKARRRRAGECLRRRRSPPRNQPTSPRDSTYCPPVCPADSRCRPGCGRQHLPSPAPPGGQNTSSRTPAGSTYRPPHRQADRTRRPARRQAAPTVPATGRRTEHVAPDADRQHLPSPPPAGGQNTSSGIPKGSTYRPPHRQVDRTRRPGIPSPQTTKPAVH